jgi:CCR4-NOT transcription complex subunit 7/8
LKDASVGSSGATGRAALERFHYDTIRLNVDLLHVIQIGFVLFDADGNSPPGNPVWQFNFRFDSARDIASSESIALLTRAGIDFGRLAREGIESERFGSLLTVSGLVLVPGSKWVTFHAGYDFAYLLKVLTALPLPSTAGAFFDKVRTFFPTVLDCKCLAASVPRRPLSGSLVSISRSLGVPSPSTLHQAGSDALLTKGCFLEVRKALQAALSGDAATTQAIEKRFTWRLFGLAGGDGGTIPSAKAAAAGGTAASGSGGAARGGLSRRR